MRNGLKKRPLGLILCLFVSLGAANGCDRFYGDSASLKSTIGNRQQLKVATISGLWTRQQIGHLNWGLEADLLQDFANSAGIQLQFQVFKDAEQARQSLFSGQSDLAALHSSGAVPSQVEAGPLYQETQVALICPKNLSEKNPEIWISDRHESFALRDELKARGYLSLLSMPQNLASIFKKSALKNANCIVAEISEAKSVMTSFPGFKIIEPNLVSQSLRFWLTKKDPKLERALIYWQQKITQDGTLLRILDRYRNSANALNALDHQLLYNSLDDLMTYQKFFLSAAAEHRLPWALLAAVSFQESHWQADARSYTGVRGLMMLTEDAADHVGIDDRNDPEQSIWGGGKYLRFLWNSFPQNTPDRERLALTLAAYNVGFGHLRDAQLLASRQGLDAYSWRDLRKVLPLLSDPEIAQKLEYGIARGQEPVDFTERTLAYFDLLHQLYRPVNGSLHRY